MFNFHVRTAIIYYLTQDVVEEVTVVVVRVKHLFDGWTMLNSGIYVTEVELLIQD